MIGLLVSPVASSKRPPGISSRAFSRLTEFEGAACKELLSEDDWNRFFDFITAAHEAPARLCAKDLHRWFVNDRGWPDDFAGDLCHFYERSCAMLRHAGFHEQGHDSRAIPAGMPISGLARGGAVG